jgi:hypothetical protein
MSKTVNYYRIFCITENKYVNEWNTLLPTYCPNNKTDIIDSNSISVIDTITSNNVNVVQSNAGVSGNYLCESYSFVIPPNSKVSNDYSWPINIASMTVNWTQTEIERGNVINCFIAPDTTIGVITSGININDKVINVSSTVIEYLNVGYMVNITDGVNNNVLGRCVNIDKINNRITVETPVNKIMNAGSYVQMMLNNIRDFIIGNPESVHLGTKHLGSSFLPANTKVRVVYENNSRYEVVYTFYLELLF